MKRTHTRQISRDKMIEHGKRFQSIRLEIGHTLEEMADEIGVHRTTLSKWEKGVSIPQTDIRVIERRFESVFRRKGILKNTMS